MGTAKAGTPKYKLKLETEYCKTQLDLRSSQGYCQQGCITGELENWKLWVSN